MAEKGGNWVYVTAYGKAHTRSKLASPTNKTEPRISSSVQHYPDSAPFLYNQGNVDAMFGILGAAIDNTVGGNQKIGPIPEGKCFRA